MKEWHGHAGMALTIAAVTASLSGCTTMGGNVKGSFACGAPAGVCAPTSKIDDQALAMISGDGGEVTPSGGVIDPSMQGMPGVMPVSADARLTRSSEKVLRIVFPAHIDRLGQYREASAIHAVVERGAWMAASSGVTGNPKSVAAVSEQQLAMDDQSTSLAQLAAGAPEVAFPQDATEQASVAPSEPTALLPDSAAPSAAPSAAAVAAARHAGRVEKARARKEVLVRGAGVAVSPQPRVAAGAPRPIGGATANVRSSAAAYSSVAPAPHGVAGSSPLQSIKDQVGGIFAASKAGRGTLATTAAPAAMAKSGSVERAANSPAVFSVSGVE